jgi:basic amino acid/polyamine antiporter, APA family
MAIPAQPCLTTRPGTGQASSRPPAPGGPPGAGLAREVAPWALVALTVNCVVGAGVLGLPGRVFALAGPQTPWVLWAAGALAGAVALCLAELAGRFDGAGGPALYLDRSFGPLAGFGAGWLLWSATVLGAASLLDLLAGLLTPAGGMGRSLAILLLSVILTLLTLAGARRSTLASAALTLLKVGLLIAVTLVAFLAPASPARPPPGPAHPATALVLVFFAFVGFERPTAMAGEVRDARLTVPAALIAATLAIGLLYAAVFSACLRDLPTLAASPRPLGELAVRSLGAHAAGAVDVATGVIVLGTLFSQWITAPRLLLALADQGRLPAPLRRLHPRRRTPDLAILTTGLTAAILALVGGFAEAATASSAARLLIFLGCGAAVLKLRRDSPRASDLHLPGVAWLAAAVVPACALLLLTAGRELIHLSAVIVVGGLLWLWTAWIPRLRRSR